MRTALGKGDMWTQRKGWELAQQMAFPVEDRGTGVSKGKAFSEGMYCNKAEGRPARGLYSGRRRDGKSSAGQIWASGEEENVLEVSWVPTRDCLVFHRRVAML